MEEKGLELINSKEERDKNIGRVEVLDRVGGLMILPNTEMTTLPMVAEFYKVSDRQIQRIIKDNREEIESDGYRVWKVKEIVEFFTKMNNDTNVAIGNVNNDTYETPVKPTIYRENNTTIIDFNDENDNFLTVPNTGKALFTKRAVLRIGMLLRDSEVSKEVRSRLLDVYHDAEMGKENIIGNIVSEIDEEKKLMLERVEAEFNYAVKK